MPGMGHQDPPRLIGMRVGMLMGDVKQHSLFGARRGWCFYITLIRLV